MTITNFKKQVAAYVNRTVASFTVDSQDILLAAMNDARRSAQREHAFELNRTENCFLVTSASGANWMTGCTSTPGGSSVIMRRIDEVWNYTTETSTGSGGGTYYPRVSRIDFSYSGQQKRDYPTVNDSRYTVNPQNWVPKTQFAYVVGPTLFMQTITTMTSYKLVGVQWLDDLTGSENPDIFLTYYTDWFKYATIKAINAYLKDTERFPIDEQMLATKWQSVKSHDGDVANMGESATLD